MPLSGINAHDLERPTRCVIGDWAADMALDVVISDPMDPKFDLEKYLTSNLGEGAK